MPPKLSVHEAVAVLLWRSPTQYHCTYVYRSLSQWFNCADYLFQNERSVHPDLRYLLHAAPAQLTLFETISRLQAFANVLYVHYTYEEQANILKELLSCLPQSILAFSTSHTHRS